MMKDAQKIRRIFPKNTQFEHWNKTDVFSCAPKFIQFHVQFTKVS